MNKIRQYKANHFFSRDFPFTILHRINRAEDFNPSRRFLREFWKIVYIIEGEGEFVVQDSSYPIRPSSFFLVQPNALTTYDIRTGALELYNIIFDYSFIAHELENLKDDFHIFSVFSPDAAVSEVSLYIQKGDARINRLVRTMVREFDEKPVNYRYCQKLKLLELLILMHRNSEKRVRHTGREKVVEYIEHMITRNLSGSLNLDTLAKQIGVTKNHLCALFRDATGGSIIAMRKKARLEAAAARLRSSSQTIAEICYGSGFNDLSYFYRAFEQEFGVNPGRYRETAAARD